MQLATDASDEFQRNIFCFCFCFCSVWTTETVCKVLKANIKDKVFCPNSEGSEDEEIFPYPCLQVWVNLTASGQEVMLYQTEDTLEKNPKVLATQIAYSFSAVIRGEGLIAFKPSCTVTAGVTHLLHVNVWA